MGSSGEKVDFVIGILRKRQYHFLLVWGCIAIAFCSLVSANNNYTTDIQEIEMNGYVFKGNKKDNEVMYTIVSVPTNSQYEVGEELLVAEDSIVYRQLEYKVKLYTLRNVQEKEGVSMAIIFPGNIEYIYTKQRGMELWAPIEKVEGGPLVLEKPKASWYPDIIVMIKQVDNIFQNTVTNPREWNRDASLLTLPLLLIGSLIFCFPKEISEFFAYLDKMTLRIKYSGDIDIQPTKFMILMYRISGFINLLGGLYYLIKSFYM